MYTRDTKPTAPEIDIFVAGLVQFGILRLFLSLFSFRSATLVEMLQDSLVNKRKWNLPVDQVILLMSCSVNELGGIHRQVKLTEIYFCKGRNDHLRAINNSWCTCLWNNWDLSCRLQGFFHPAFVPEKGKTVFTIKGSGGENLVDKVIEMVLHRCCNSGTQEFRSGQKIIAIWDRDVQGECERESTPKAVPWIMK